MRADTGPTPTARTSSHRPSMLRRDFGSWGAAAMVAAVISRRLDLAGLGRKAREVDLVMGGKVRRLCGEVVG